ncbi:hypothetical protein [Ferruginibacter sp.]
MRSQKKYLFGFWVLIFIVLLRSLSLVILWYNLQGLSALNTTTSFWQIISPIEIVHLIILTIEAFAYWFLRFDIKNKRWVRLHVWLLLLAIVIIPAVITGIVFYGSHYLGLQDYTLLKIRLSITEFYRYWILIIAGHGFFILTLSKYFGAKKEIIQTHSSTEILDEFAAEE